MPAADILHTYAVQMKAAQDAVHQIEPFSARDGSFDLAAAYAVADLIHRERVAQGLKPVGRKIGFTNPDMWSIYGVAEPIWAYVYDSTVVRARGGHIDCSLGRFTEPKIEPEIVLHFRTAPPVNGDLDAILASIDWVAHAFEIVQSHFPGWKFKAADTVADWALHGTLLVGEPQDVADLGEDPVGMLETFALTLYRNDVLQETGRGANVLGSPLRAIAHLIAVLQKQSPNMPLQAGELVTTGTITKAFAVQTGERWRTEVRGLAVPGLSVSFV